jgi:hypothetical protein
MKIEELISYRDDVRDFMIKENPADTRLLTDVHNQLLSLYADQEAKIKTLAEENENLKEKYNNLVELWNK